MPGVVRKVRKIKTRDTTTTTALAVSPFCLLRDQCGSKVAQEVVERLEIEQSEIEYVYPCTRSQENLFAQTIANSTESVAERVYTLPRNCGLPKFVDAWQQVLKANPILRAHIVQAGARNVQVVLRSQPELSRGSDLNTYLDLDWAYGMRLDESLLPAALITEQYDEDEASGIHYMGISVHPALHDERSEALMLGQLEAAYWGASLRTRQLLPFVKLIQNGSSRTRWRWKEKMMQKNAPTAVLPPAHFSTYRLVRDSIPNSFMELSTTHKSPGLTFKTQLRSNWDLVMPVLASLEAEVLRTAVERRSAMTPDIEAATGPTSAVVPSQVYLTPTITIEEMFHRIQDTTYRAIPPEQLGLQSMKKIGDGQGHCQSQSRLAIHPQQTSNRSKSLLAILKRRTRSFWPGTRPLTLECNIPDNKGITQRLLHHFKDNFAEIPSSVTRSVTPISLIASCDVAQLTEWHNELRGSQPKGQLMVHELIARQCSSRPAATAVHAWDGKFSYRDLELLSSRLAAELVRKDVRTESIVPICFEKSKWLAVIMVAVVKAGAAFVLLDPSTQPLERMQLIVKQAKGELVIASNSLLSTAAQMPGTRPLLVAAGASCFDSHPVVPSSWPEITGNTALYVIFTSGSTGTPKGVVIEHHGYSAGALSRCEVTGLNSGSRVLQFSSCTFDTFITDILDTLIAGACICIPSESARHSGLAQAARDMRVTYADLVPSVARLISFEEIPTLETLVLSGEPVTRRDMADWADKVRLCNLYGPAECSAVATGHAYSGSHSNPSNIGRVCGGAGWVVSPTEHNVLLPIGAVGELVLEGSIVGRGYLGQVAGKASSNFLSFLPAWRAQFPGMNGDTRMYKTGDLVQYQDDGTLLFVGRKDDQVKLHGQRLELGDVEHHLRTAFPASSDVVAAIVSSPVERLVAFIVVGNAQGKDNVTAPSLIEQALMEEGIHIATSSKFRFEIRHAEKLMRKHVPTYMVPTAYFPIQQLPRTSSGKVNRARLQQAASQLLLRDGLASFTAAREKRDTSTEAEKVLQAVWAQVLGIDRSAISAEDGFLELGGDSIAAMRVATLAASRGLHISVPKLFQNESLQSLTATISSHASLRRIVWEEEVAFSRRILEHAAHQAQCQPLLCWRSPVEVLLTGATGRLGREILKQLVECPLVCVVHCVAVRCPEKLSPHKKVIVYHGDLSKPRLGMSEQEETAVLRRCQVIIHCGAVVSFVQNYETMRPVNVESTKYLADLALQSRLPFHYISTVDVGPKHRHAVMQEATVAWNEPRADGSDGYMATKWVSEVFLERVSSHFGLDVTIHRPSNIICDGDPETDIVNNLLEYSRRIRAVPQLKGWEGQFDFIQGHMAAFNIVESVLAGIDRITQDGPQSRRDVQYIHESGETVFPISALGAYLVKDGSRPLKTIEMRQWAEQAIQEGMATIVSDFLCGIEETGERVILSPIKTSRWSVKNRQDI